MLGEGSSACELTEKVFKAGNVMASVSTAKIPRVVELPGEDVVDRYLSHPTHDEMTQVASHPCGHRLD